MEIARTLASLPKRPKRSVVFIALFGEELGLVGSRYYGRHPIFPLAKTVADLNLEQVGRTDVDGGKRVGQLNVTGYDFSSITAELKKAAEPFGIEVIKDEQNSDAFFGRSDNQAFADAGVPPTPSQWATSSRTITRRGTSGPNWITRTWPASTEPSRSPFSASRRIPRRPSGTPSIRRPSDTSKLIRL